MKKLKKQLKQLQQAYRDLGFKHDCLEDENTDYQHLVDKMARKEKFDVGLIHRLSCEVAVLELENAILNKSINSAESALIYKEDLYDKALHAIGVLTIRAGVE